jgi:aminodeoxyfutalosine deaminase
MTYPKIELHVHLDSAMRPSLLLRLARRNGYVLPFATVEEFADYCQVKKFEDLGRIWVETCGVLKREQDFREVLVAYAGEAKSHGAVYVEAIFNPWMMWKRGVSLDAIFTGYCDAIEEARGLYGVEVRLTPDGDLWSTPEEAAEIARYAVAYRDRGVVGFGMSGSDRHIDPAAFARAAETARDGGLGYTPHAGEFGGAHLVRLAIETLGASRVRHGLGAIEDPALMREAADRGIGFDICLISNMRLGATPSLEEHPITSFVAAGIRCSVSSDDPALLDTNLERDHAAARSLGLTPKQLYDAALAGVLCDDETRLALHQLADSHNWSDTLITRTTRDPPPIDRSRRTRSSTC